MGVWSLWQKMWFMSSHTHLFLNMHAHFNKCEISRKSKSKAHPRSPEQPGVGTLVPWWGHQTSMAQPPCHLLSSSQGVGKRKHLPLLHSLPLLLLGKRWVVSFLGWVIHVLHIYHGKEFKNIYLSPLGQLRFEVWWIDQSAWGYRRPLKTLQGELRACHMLQSYPLLSTVCFYKKNPKTQKMFQSS